MQQYLRNLLFRLHWGLGLTAGLVLSVMGISGALMSYEDAITSFANRDRTSVVRREFPPLSPANLVARVQMHYSELRVVSLMLWSDPTKAAVISFDDEAAAGGTASAVYVDPCDGTVVGQVRLDGTFATIRALHRWLLLPGNGKGWGRTITGACALSFLILLAIGLYLRWPKLHRLRIWFRPRLGSPGRGRWWSLHAIVGTWLLPIYLLIVLSGLNWSYPGYRDTVTWLLTGKAPQTPDTVVKQSEIRASATGQDLEILDRIWSNFKAGEGVSAARSLVLLAKGGSGAIRIRWWESNDAALADRNDASFSAMSGAPLMAIRNTEKQLGRRIADNMLEVHRGRFFGRFAAFLFFLAALALPGFAATGIILYVLRRKSIPRPNRRSIDRRVRQDDPVRTG